MRLSYNSNQNFNQEIEEDPSPRSNFSFQFFFTFRSHILYFSKKTLPPFAHDRFADFVILLTFKERFKFVKLTLMNFSNVITQF